MNFLSQPDMVRASLLAEEQVEHHRDVYKLRNSHPQKPRTADGKDPACERAVEGTVSHGARPTETSRDGRAGRPTPCPRCHGDGEITFRHNWLDPQTEDSEECRECAGTGTARRAA